MKEIISANLKGSNWMMLQLKKNYCANATGLFLFAVGCSTTRLVANCHLQYLFEFLVNISLVSRMQEVITLM